MVEMPWSLAFLMTVAADGLSRFTSSSVVAPPLIIWSAMVANFALSPLAFWMSYWIPAFLNASPRYLRSAVSQRAEEAASGRITPILPFGLLVEAVLEVSLLSSLPHAATNNDTIATATRAR